MDFSRGSNRGFNRWFFDFRTFINLHTKVEHLLFQYIIAIFGANKKRNFFWFQNKEKVYRKCLV